jgi:hypothetical protein
MQDEKAIEALWDEFKEYVCRPYQGDLESNPHRRAITLWFDELHARFLAGQNLRLEKNTVTKTDGTQYETFSLNRQMHFSHDSSVLALPHMDSLESSRMVGVWVHDHGQIPDNDNNLRAFITKSREANPGRMGFDDHNIKQANLSSPYVTDILGAIRQKLGATGLLGGKANQLQEDQSADIRYSALKPVGTMHRDHDGNHTDDQWHRVLITALHGHGTTFGLIPDEESILVFVPQGMVSSHIESGDKGHRLEHHGAYHAVTVDPDGRTIVLTGTEWEFVLSSREAYSIKVQPMAPTL